MPEPLTRPETTPPEAQDLPFWCKVGKKQYARLLTLFVDGRLGGNGGIVCPDWLTEGQTVWVRREHLRCGYQDPAGTVVFNGSFDGTFYNPRRWAAVRTRKARVERVDLEYRLASGDKGAVWLRTHNTRDQAFFGVSPAPAPPKALTYPASLVRQPEDSNLCGQACVATILNISLDEACVLVGKRGLTSTRHIRNALAKRGVVLGPRIKPGDGDGLLCICCLHWPPVGRRHGHWVIRDAKGTVLDPAYGADPPWVPGTRITSAYSVTFPT